MKKMKKMKHMLVFALVFAMLLSMAPMTAARAEETGTSDGVNTETELIDAIAVGGEITITGDIALTQAVTISNIVTLKAASKVTITTDVVDVFTVTTGGVLTLGENITVNATNSILYANGGTVNVDGATLTSNHGKNALGFVDNNGTITVKSGTIESVWTGFTADNATLNITGGTIKTSGSNAVIVRNNSTAVISGEETAIETTGTYATLWVKTGGTLEVKGGTITAVENQGPVSVEGATATISSGTFKGSVVSANGEGTLTITGGTFTEAPAADYVADGYVAIPNADDTWTIAEAAPVEPEVVLGTEGGVSEDIADAAEEAGITEETLKEALAGNDNGDSLKAVLPTVEVSADEAKSALGNKYNPDSEDEVTVEVRPSVNVEVTGLDAAKNTMTLDITASYATYAVQGNEEAEITGKFGVLNLTGKTMTITVPLPEGFTGENVLVNHSKDDVIKETIVATVDAEAKTITFTTTMGFSTFEVVDVDVTHNLTLDSEIAFSFFIDKEDLETTNGYIATIYKILSLSARENVSLSTRW